MFTHLFQLKLALFLYFSVVSLFFYWEQVQQAKNVLTDTELLADNACLLSCTGACFQAVLSNLSHSQDCKRKGK